MITGVAAEAIEGAIALAGEMLDMFESLASQEYEAQERPSSQLGINPYPSLQRNAMQIYPLLKERVPMILDHLS